MSKGYSGSPSFGILSTYPPTPCGLATFSAALANGLETNGADVSVVRVSDGPPSPPVWKRALPPGKYALNPYALKLELVPTVNFVLRWITGQVESHHYDEDLNSIELITADGYEPILPLSLVLHIDYEKATAFPLVRHDLKPTAGKQPDLLSDERLRPARLLESMRYAVLGGGKRLRPFLVVETAHLFAVPRAQALQHGPQLEADQCERH